MLKGIFICQEGVYDKVYGPAERRDVAKHVDIYAPPQTAAAVEANPSLLADADVILGSWGMAKLDEAFLEAAANLKAVFYGAGSIRRFMTEAAWDRGILVTSSYAANAIPTAEFAFAQILFSLKRGWYYVLTTKRERKRPPRITVPGAYGSTVGLISLGKVGSHVARLLQPFDVEVLAYDVEVGGHTSSEAKAAKRGARLCSLEEIFARVDVVSLHTPWLKETEGMITGQHLASMKPNAVFVNTARGAVVREGEMIEVLQQRPDLYAVLDVTYPEPPEPGSLLYTLPNVVLTPHIAGSMDQECRRMGRYAVDELARYVAGEPLQWAISRDVASRLA